jgi:hypothetical protein
MNPATIVIAALVASLTAGMRPALADAPADALPSERPTLIEATLFARYDRLPGEVHGGRAGLSARALLGRRLGYCLGVDLDVGGSQEGVTYGAVLQLVGAGLRIGDAGLVSLCGGAGVGGARGVVPAALELPVELRARAQLGPVRLLGWLTGRWTAGSDRRHGGSRIDAADELDAAIAIGWGRQQRYWEGTSAGSGPYVGLAYRELMDEQVVAIVMGIELLGGN